MSWSSFIIFAIIAVLLWTVGAFFALRGKRKGAVGTTLAGLVVFFAFIIGMWISLQRPPLRTLGETRLWYSFFLSLVGLIVYVRWRYNWILSFSTILSTVFICVNLFKPEIHDQTLMPALQSPWFAPHVIVYMFAYAMLGAATLMAIYYLVLSEPCGRRRHGGTTGHGTPRRHGPPSPGSPISSSSITDSSPNIVRSSPSGCSSSASSCCKSAGGASTTSPPPKEVPAYTFIKSTNWLN